MVGVELGEDPFEDLVGLVDGSDEVVGVTEHLFELVEGQAGLAEGLGVVETL